MKMLIAGICGFVGATLAKTCQKEWPNVTIFGMDNFIRPGSYSNIADLKSRGIRLFHGDLRCGSDFETLPDVDWVIDCAAHSSVLAGVNGQVNSRQLIEHNLFGTVNMLEFCRARHSGFILISTSRVYSIKVLSSLPLVVRDETFVLDQAQPLPDGVTYKGVSEKFSTDTPVSLYGATKLASEKLSLEYGEAFDFPVFINRCGVLAGAGQFGYADQGIFSYWINSWIHKRPLRYIGFGGGGFQVRDCLHPADIAPLIQKQMNAKQDFRCRICNIGGGIESAISLKRLSLWCSERYGAHQILSDSTLRDYDIPWLVLDTGLAKKEWGWNVRIRAEDVFQEIANHSLENPDWLTKSSPYIA